VEVKLCGITVAPIMPMAKYNDRSFNAVGIKPLATSITCGCTINISNKKASPTINISDIIKPSKFAHAFIQQE
jgi:hypothetical protein